MILALLPLVLLADPVAAAPTGVAASTPAGTVATPAGATTTTSPAPRWAVTKVPLFPGRAIDKAQAVGSSLLALVVGSADGQRREVWAVPPGGEPVPLGELPAGADARASDTFAVRLGDGAQGEALVLQETPLRLRRFPLPLGPADDVIAISCAPARRAVRLDPDRRAALGP